MEVSTFLMAFMMVVKLRVENGREFQGLVSGTEKLRNFQNLWNSSISSL
jgi:hypothetical protein